MVDKKTAIKTAKAFIEECKESGLTFYKVLLFGSYAQDKMHEWSDIDLLLVSDQFGENVFDNLKLFSKINIKYPIIETHPYPTSYFIESDDFLDKIKQESIEI
jgi:predicted nucleotidyltransferase